MTASGVLLGAINSRSPNDTSQLLQSSLKKYNEMPKAQRLRKDMPSETQEHMEDRHPKDGLALRQYSRDLPRPDGRKPAEQWQQKAWNTDTIWFMADEMRQWLPPGTVAKGQLHEVPAALVRRLGRFAFIDNVRGQTNSFEDANIEKGTIAIEVAGVKDGIVTLKMTGEARAVRRGRWAVGGHEDTQQREQERGYDLKLAGRATFDSKKNRFTTFDLVAVGERWGGTQYNRRDRELEKAPIGYVLTLAAEGDTTAPSEVYNYGWR